MLRAFTAVSILVLTVTTAKAYPYPPVEVTFGDLDLSRPSDANVLRERVGQAALDGSIHSRLNVRYWLKADFP